MFKTILTLRKIIFSNIYLQALRKSTIKRNCILFDTKEKYVIHADEQYKLTKKRINNQEQKQKIKTDNSCMCYSISIVTNTVDCYQ